MKNFRDINELDAWLEGMDWQGFWYAIAPCDLDIPDRVDTERQITDGTVSQETAFEVVKGFARIELTKRYDLKRRQLTPWVQLVETH